jgi:hypothetical protein
VGRIPSYGLACQELYQASTYLRKPDDGLKSGHNSVQLDLVSRATAEELKGKVEGFNQVFLLHPGWRRKSVDKIDRDGAIKIAIGRCSDNSNPAL